MHKGIAAPLLIALASLLGCGGGGGAGDGGGGGPAPVTVTLSARSVTVSAEPGGASEPQGHLTAQVDGDFSAVFGDSAT